jgi:hypothetical protein
MDLCRGGGGGVTGQTRLAHSTPEPPVNTCRCLAFLELRCDWSRYSVCVQYSVRMCERLRQSKSSMGTAHRPTNGSV